MSFSGFGECLPRYENYCALDKEKVDAWGIPVLHISMAFGDNEKKMCKDMSDTAAEMLRGGGRRERAGRTRGHGPLRASTIHEVGTARMGNDPKTSVVNRWQQAHEVEQPVRDGRRGLPELGLPEPDPHHHGPGRPRLRLPGGGVPDGVVVEPSTNSVRTELGQVCGAYFFRVPSPFTAFGSIMAARSRAR